MVERATEKRTKENWRGYYDCAISVATWHAAGRSLRVGHLGSSQQTADTDRTNIIFRARRRNRSCCMDSSRRQRKLHRRTELWLCDEKMPTPKAARNKNKHRGSSFESFLKKQGLHEQVHAAALKRAVALKVHDLMKQQRMSKSAMAARMRTSRAAIHRLLDPENTSVTLATLNRAARSLGRKVKIELVAA